MRTTMLVAAFLISEAVSQSSGGVFEMPAVIFGVKTTTFLILFVIADALELFAKGCDK